MKKVIDHLGNRSICRICMTCLLLLFCSCSHIPSEYLAAVEDAANPEPIEICDNLLPISNANADLVQKTVGGKEFVLVVTWVGEPSYYKKTGPDGVYNTGKRYIWVTVVPELEKRCGASGFGDNDLDLRLKQLLGMPERTKKSHFVEFWVHPQDLFRPCPDPEIDDRRCGLNLADTVSADHREWFNRLRAKSYCRSDHCPSLVPYPWTQLGYTYDWGIKDPHVGLSEFVIHRNSNVIVNRIFSTLEYCRGE